MRPDRPTAHLVDHRSTWLLEALGWLLVVATAALTLLLPAAWPLVLMSAVVVVLGRRRRHATESGGRRRDAVRREAETGIAELERWLRDGGAAV